MATPGCPVTQWAGSQQIGGMSGTIHDVEEHNEHDDGVDDDDDADDVADMGTREISGTIHDVDDDNEHDDEVDDDDVAHRGILEMCGSFVSDKGVLS